MLLTRGEFLQLHDCIISQQNEQVNRQSELFEQFGVLHKMREALSVSFYNNFVKLCNKSGKKPSAVAEEIGLSRSLVTRWKSGRGITDSTAQRIAEYFEVSVDELMAEEEEKEKSPSQEDELAEELQMLRDDPDARAVLRSMKTLKPEQVLLLRQWLETMK